MKIGNITLDDKVVHILGERLTPKPISKLITFQELRNMVSAEEGALIDQLLQLQPDDVGIDMPFVGIHEPGPKDGLVEMPREVRHINLDGSIKKYTDKNYLPRHAWQDWQKLNGALGNKLDVASAYRSPAYQVLLLAYRLDRAAMRSSGGGDVSEVFNRHSLPGYSQHGLLDQTAIDVVAKDEASQVLADFEKSPQFAQMLKHAQDYNFYLSYPKDDLSGIDYEPWHWQWRRPT